MERLTAENKEQLLAEGRELVRTTSLKHVAFIVDGNRRWAESRGLPPIEGYRESLKKVLEVVESASYMGIEVLTFWLWSTENWRREGRLIRAIFNLGREIKDRARDNMMRLNVRFKHLGRKDRLPKNLLNTIVSFERKTGSNSGLIIQAAIDYGGRDELRRATNKAIAKILAGGKPIKTEKEYEEFLDTAGVPDPDLIVRTAGEIRTSGFLPWQSVYSEWVFLELPFPDFKTRNLVEALREFSTRKRRFGH